MLHHHNCYSSCKTSQNQLEVINIYQILPSVITRYNSFTIGWIVNLRIQVIVPTPAATAHVHSELDLSHTSRSFLNNSIGSMHPAM